MVKMLQEEKGLQKKYIVGFLEVGAQVVTLGNHTWDNREIFEFIDEAKYLVRPANFPENNPGKGIVYLKMNQDEVAVISLQGRTFLPPIDCPFQKADELIREAQ